MGAKVKGIGIVGQKINVVMGVYENYDLTGGGPPFGHVRTFRAELSFGKKKIVRYGNAGQDLVALVKKKGKPIGDSKSLPPGRDYSSGYKQKYLISAVLAPEKIEQLIPFENVLSRVSF